MIRKSFDGNAEFKANLDKLDKKARDTIAREGTNAGRKLMTKAVKAAAPKETGTLKKAIGDKQKKYQAGRLHLAIIGARVGFKKQVIRTFTKRGKQRIKLAKTTAQNKPGEIEVRDAAHYSHIAERGRKAVHAKGGRMPIRTKAGKLLAVRSAKAFGGHHFMAKTLKTSWPRARAAMLAKLRAEMTSALNSLRAA